MRREHDGLSVGHVLDSVDEPEPEVLELADDYLVVDEFMQTVDVPEPERLRYRGVDARAHSMRLYDLDLHAPKLRL